VSPAGLTGLNRKSKRFALNLNLAKTEVAEEKKEIYNSDKGQNLI
jgi:hypothetical protein